jgi:hypothetical protein
MILAPGRVSGGPPVSPFPFLPSPLLSPLSPLPSSLFSPRSYVASSSPSLPASLCSLASPLSPIHSTLSPVSPLLAPLSSLLPPVSLFAALPISCLRFHSLAHSFIPPVASSRNFCLRPTNENRATCTSRDHTENIITQARCSACVHVSCLRTACFVPCAHMLPASCLSRAAASCPARALGLSRDGQSKINNNHNNNNNNVNKSNINNKGGLRRGDWVTDSNHKESLS